jgi:uncharacterized membrane protein
MHSVHEEVSIAAPVDRVWKVVHEDLENAPEWTTHLKRAHSVNGKSTGAGSRLRYELELPAWKGYIEVEQTVWEPGRRCAGEFTDGPLKGSWSYTYRALKSGTKLVYDMDFELRGMLRFLGGVLAREYASGIRQNMASLKEYVESGRGPRA